MKKLSLLFFTAFITGDNHRIKASKIFFLAFLFCCFSNSGFAQVTVTPNAPFGTNICNGPAAPTVCTTLGDIVIDETNNTDFAAGTDVLTIVPPTGWAFCVGTCPTFSLTAGGDITAVVGGGCFADHMTINITSAGTSFPDHIRIVGLQVQPLAGGGETGSINPSGASGITGISLSSPATDFGDLSLSPGIITTDNALGFSICAGGTLTLSDPISGGVWSSNNPIALTIDPSSGVATSPSVNDPTSTPTVFYTIGSCSASVVITVNANPSPIVGVHDICENVCYPISDAYTNGNGNFFHSLHAAVTNTGGFGTSGTATLCGVLPGIDTIYYTTGTGCTTTATLSVDPLPSPIIDPSGTYKICAGSAEFLSDASPGGIWTSTNSALATITPNTGDLSAVSAGRDTIIYTLSYANNVTCAVDTPMTINPVPLTITGANNVCVFSTTQLSDATSSGSWASSNNSFATVTNTGLVTGVSAGVVTISYILNTGCYVIHTMTVNPVPDHISGPIPATVCATYQIFLNETSTGGTWSSSNTSVATVGSSTGIVTGVSGSIQLGADSIFYTFPTGCNAIFPITVDSLPDSIRGPQSVCQGQSVTLTDATSGVGGVWTSQLPGFASVVNSGSNPDGVVTGIQVGVILISYTLPTGCFITQAETINPLGPITGPNQVCEGDSITLNDAAQPGTWSSSNTAIATIDLVTGILKGISSTAGTPPGIAIVSFTNTSGCTATATITVNPSPAVITGPDSVCVGSTITLSDSTNYTGGVWSSNNTFIATAVNGLGTSGTIGGIAAGTDIISYQLPAGCLSTISIRVDPLPGPILGPLSVCQGSSVTLSDASTPGTWTSSNSSISAIDPLLGTVTTNNFGTDTITYTLATGCKTDTAFTVNPLDSITGPAVPVVCTGSTITLSNNTSGGPGVWTSNNTGIATIDPFTGVLTGTQPGPNSAVVTITYTLPTSCSITYTVLVNPLPDSITGPSSVCQGQFITLSDATPGGTWGNGNNAIDTINVATGVVGGVSPGIDQITYTLSATGCLITTSLTVNALTDILPPIPHDVCVGLSINLTDATAGGTWSSSNSSVATVGLSSGVVTGASAGIDTISYSIILTGCTTTTTVLVNPLPDSITGMMPVCVNSYIVLSDATDSAGGGIWFVGNPAIATITDTLLTGVSAGISNITYQIIATGCIQTATVLVNPLPRPISVLPNVCIFDSAVYSDPDTLGVWSANPTSVATIATITDSIGHLHAVSTGVVVITYTLPTTCAITETVTIRPLPVVSITQSDSGIICKGATDTLTATGAGPSGIYAWTPPYRLSSTGPDSFTYASPLVTTTYTVTETTIYGCHDTGSTTVHVDTALNHLAISGRDSICAGGYDTLMITGGVDSIYFWKPPTGLNCTNCQTTIANPINTITYWAIAVDFLGCTDSTSFTVTVNPIPNLVIDPNPTIVCKRSTATVTVSGAGTGAHYTWSPNVFISCDTCATVVLSDTANITYEVVGTSQFGCTDSISVKVSVLDTNVNTISDDTLICIGKSAQLLATSHGLTSNTSDPTYIWSPASSLNNPYIFNPIATPDITTVYTLVVTENVCFSKTEYVQVTVEPLPAISITVSPSTTVIAGTQVQLLASAPNVVADSFLWTPANTLSCDTCYNPIATPVQGTTTYMVTVISNFGCIASDTVTIHLFCDNSQIFIPNSFTPNGDGVNDRFYPSGKGITIINDFAVYNRWGQLLFEAHNFNVSDPGAGWDGTYKGHVLEPDVFIYKLTGTCELGEPFSYTGDVSILR